MGRAAVEEGKGIPNRGEKGALGRARHRRRVGGAPTSLNAPQAMVVATTEGVGAAVGER